MSSSLRDQLVKAGLASKQSADSQNAKSRKKHKKPALKTAADVAAKKAADAKREKDKTLNAALREKQRKTAVKSQIKDLIEQHAVANYLGEIGYSYISGTKVRKLFVQQIIHEKLSSDQLAITRLNGKTYLVPVAITDRILTLNPAWSVNRPGSDSGESIDDDSPYSDFQVPDDLNW
jgi:uncharacterized protein YaiL (DUF2058 family)